MAMDLLVCIPPHLRFYRSISHAWECSNDDGKFPLLGRMDRYSHRQHVHDLSQMEGIRRHEMKELCHG